jgi:hypothetical protein
MAPRASSACAPSARLRYRWPVVAWAQQRADRVRRIAWFGLGRSDEPSPYVDSLRAGLRDLGWIEGRNLTIGLFWATGREDMEAAGRELLASDPEVIVTQELMVFAMRSLKTVGRGTAQNAVHVTRQRPIEVAHVGPDQFALDAKLPSVSGWSPFARETEPLCRCSQPVLAHRSPYAFEGLLTEVLRTWSGMPDRRF